ncbi:MAG: PEP-CTERM sorting domain-containing protein [Verrucomicrobia bacterium]|nr:PEP-CTERM sorting domain-containing protein [Verrucomicrobiota bacterium]MBM4011144.1 PEP-CTERM sorting domain-containing protein [Planctomycetota bacterium]
MTRFRPLAVAGFFVAASLGLCATAAQAATTTYTSSSSFQSSLPAGYYFNDFVGVPDSPSSPVTSVTGTGGIPTVGYTITAPTSGLGVFPDAGFKAVGNWNRSQDMVVTFNTGNVASAGADIWISDINGNRLAGNVTVNFSDGSSVSVPSTTTGAFGFAGITITDAPLTTMTVVNNNVTGYLNVSNMSVAAVPEPSSLAATALAMAAMAGVTLQRRRRA